MNLLIELLAFAVAIGVLVVVHEYGHYSVARLCGVKVLRFSIGFGKPLFQWVSPKTGTEWTIAALLLGGYVKMLDERETGGAPIPAEALPHAFNRQSVWRRFAIVAAGPVANFLLAIVLFALVFATGVTEPAAVVAAPAPNTPAALAGFDGGETIACRERRRIRASAVVVRPALEIAGRGIRSQARRAERKRCSRHLGFPAGSAWHH